MTVIRSDRPIMRVGASTALAWLGLYLHNHLDLPQLTIFSPETSVPGLIFAVLFAAWWLLPARWITASLLLSWALLHLIGGAIISVIPFPFLPFYPEQSVRHYAAHVVYGAAQVPLIIGMIRQINRLSDRQRVRHATVQRDRAATDRVHR